MTSETFAPWATADAVLAIYRRSLRHWQPGLRRAEVRRLQRAAGCAFYQAGVLCHRNLLLREITSALEASKSAGDPDSAVLRLLAPLDFAERAARYYDIALAFSPHLAEARYNQASIHRSAGRLRDAMRSYEAALTLAPHPMAKAHAFLHANAAWEAAKIAEWMGRAARARGLFRKAMSSGCHFGVDQRRYPDHLDASGRSAAAMAEYDRMMSYSHRYAPEFVTPDFTNEELLPSGPNVDPLDPLQATVAATANGIAAVYFLHLYFSTPISAAVTIADRLSAAFRGGPLTHTLTRLRSRPDVPIDACAPSLAGLPHFAGDGAASPSMLRRG
jgi:tetratricopeptide (TPR) repeat protein